MDMTVEYLGLKLKNPVLPGASPMCQDLKLVEQLIASGAPAIVMHSLFEERIVAEQMDYSQTMFMEGASPESTGSYLPDVYDFLLGPDEYLNLVRKLKAEFDVPVIASLNGVSGGGWLNYSKLIADAGADALELNPYDLVCGPYATAAETENRIIEVVQEVRAQIKIPICVKLLPTVMGLPSFAERLRDAGAQGLVLFNRIYDPIIVIEELEITSRYPLTQPNELSARLRALGVVSGVPGVQLSCSGGVHDAEDGIRAILTGATTLQMVTAILQNGPKALKAVIDGTTEWFTEHEYENLAQARGSMNIHRCGNPEAYTRLGYMKSLSSYATA